MISENKYKCLKLGIIGLFGNQRKELAKSYNLFILAIWTWFIVGIILKALNPEYKNIISIMIILLILNNGFFGLYYKIKEMKTRVDNFKDLVTLFEAIEILEDSELFEELENLKVDTTKIDELLDRIKIEYLEDNEDERD